ncbi:tetratricopeptide repeat protein [Pseudoalteromonas phenolica]|uniref:tetratricopeptide repeat protein n=1 Tax=Pseudoalteromonas phenolica TaxID=161398 RepID=UPI00110BE2F1|nr:tetratricopeptide repeat protein [Pseudoalteromonas phenolica]TMO57249.1 hypothetical protein CWC21_05050 [Pseudoalteromonas phenolica]
MKNIKNIICFCLLFKVFSLYATEQVFEIELAPMKFTVPAFSETFSEREVTIAPDEYEVAEELRSLLETKDYALVSKKLETFYDLELSTALLVVKAQVYFAINEYQKAEKTYLAVLKRKPQLVRVHEDLGRLYLIKENYIKARKHFSKAISYGSNSASIFGQLGYLNMNQFGAFSAIHAYQVAHTLEPENMLWQQGLLSSLLSAKMYPAAEALLATLIQKYPKNQDLIITHASLKLSLGDYNSALIMLEKAMLLGNISNKNLKVTAKLHLRSKSYKRALELIQQHLDTNKVKLNDLKEYLDFLNKAERYVESELIISKYQENRVLADKEKSEISYYLAKINLAKNNYKEAEENFKHSIKVNENNPLALLDYAKFLMRENKFIESEVLFFRAQAFNLTEHHAMLGRAQLYINKSELSSAFELLLKVKEKFPQTVGIERQLEIVEKLATLEQQSNIKG